MEHYYVCTYYAEPELIESSIVLLKNAKIATLTHDQTNGSLISQGAILVESDVISWVGNEVDIPEFSNGHEIVNLEGRLVTPGLIDCHTHIVHGGNRAKEFEMRLQGRTYEEIARAGGGIVSTVSATRDASIEELVEQALPRVDHLLAEGVTTLEIKSGYGLDISTECNMLRAAKLIATKRPVRVRTSFLGAHTTPSEYAEKHDEYLTEVCLPALEKANLDGLVDAVDGFCEGIAFSTGQIERVFAKASELGLPVRLHAEQLSNSGGAKLAARYGAMSADHLEYANERDVEALAASKTVGVLLPGAYYAIQESKKPPVELFRNYAVPMAVATDCNPGSSPMTSILLAMNMACTLFGMTTDEVLFGVTRNAAKALGLNDCGEIRQGLRADLAIWNVEHPAELAYRFGFNPLHARVFAGEFV